VIRLWPELTAFLTDGLLRPDNNTAERALRTIALNRKNSLFLGTGKDSPNRAASAWTIFGSCRQQGIPATKYLAEITPILLDWRTAHRAKRPLPDLGHLTPKAWASRLAIHQLVGVG
jgi:transposase